MHALYSSPDIMRNIKSRRLRWTGDVPRMDESRNAYRVLVGRPEGKRSLGRSRRRLKDNIKMDLSILPHRLQVSCHFAAPFEWSALLEHASAACRVCTLRVPMYVRGHVLQHNVPTHFNLVVRAHLNNIYGEQWIWGAGPVAWSA
ncbi:hypothetical protein ANN_11266 [Periplaneta americana]|uniref:Uncharacterized protein n=1 Tax=Periplaneta americana TaxID=6978 RepID=A0ABQ8T5Q5_PERAM|nr:hypothetical protein ANN_11266 [Periplaneta americana]